MSDGIDNANSQTATPELTDADRDHLEQSLRLTDLWAQREYRARRERYDRIVIAALVVQTMIMGMGAPALWVLVLR